MTAHMVKEAIKFPLGDTQAVSKILSHVNKMAAMLSEFCSQLAAVKNNNAQLTLEGGGGGYAPRTPHTALQAARGTTPLFTEGTMGDMSCNCRGVGGTHSHGTARGGRQCRDHNPFGAGGPAHTHILLRHC